MSLSTTGFAAALVLGAVSSILAVVLRPHGRSAVVGIGTALAGGSGCIAGAGAMIGETFSFTLPTLLPLSGIRLALDPLGGLFVTVTGAVAVVAGIYGIGYARHGLDSRPVLAVFPLFVAAMLLVPAADGTGTFLLCWELMALTSLLLVVAEHRRRPEVAVAGRWYAIMTHLGLITILIGLLVLSAYAGGDAWPVVRVGAETVPPIVRDLVFVSTLIGFASKAGILPLHAWLPKAHPEAPSHVSALLSAAMVNLGVYGILRIGMDLLGGGARWWWLLVLGLGASSAVYGILQAVLDTDLKRLLGYSTTENLGLVLIGVGAAGLFASSGQDALAALALVAAMLHLTGHAAFKTLLFLSAGSVLHATGTRDLDALGGLRRPMPVTTGMFGLGALAASALPPGTAFVSEWLLLQALVHGFRSSGVAAAVAMPVAVAAVALTAGLAVATFVKAFGVGFLARPRTAAAHSARESPASMLVGMGLAALCCVTFALVPMTVLPWLQRAADVVLDGTGPAVAGTVTVQLSAVAGSLSPLILACALTAGILLIALVARLLSSRRRLDVRLWDCGSGPMSARMEYTATSFAEPLQRVFDNVVEPETDVEVTHHRESRYLVTAVAYRRAVPDRLERRIYQPILELAAAWGRVGRRLATGSVHRYLGYGFCAAVGGLVLLAVTR